jgi:hypothetical protein
MNENLLFLQCVPKAFQHVVARPTRPAPVILQLRRVAIALVSHRISYFTSVPHTKQHSE